MSYTTTPAFFRKNSKLPVTMKTNPKSIVFYELNYSYFSKDSWQKDLNNGFELKTYFKNNKTVFSVGSKDILTVKIKNDAQRNFVAAEIPIPAGMRFVDRSLLTSYSSQPLKRSHYFIHEEKKHDRLIIFSDTLPAGEYIYEIEVLLTNSGSFKVPRSKIFEMYEPQNFGFSKGYSVKINDYQ